MVGAITAGQAGDGPDGVPMTKGEADVRLHRLSETAAPGQVLMSAAAREACGGSVDAVQVRAAEDPAGEAYLFRGLAAAGRVPEGE